MTACRDRKLFPWFRRNKPLLVPFAPRHPVRSCGRYQSPLWTMGRWCPVGAQSETIRLAMTTVGSTRYLYHSMKYLRVLPRAAWPEWRFRFPATRARLSKNTNIRHKYGKLGELKP